MNNYTKLSSLIQSGVITDSSVIAIFDAEGEFVAKGPWYADKILNYCERWAGGIRPARAARSRSD